jgi:hypothetical protein
MAGDETKPTATHASSRCLERGEEGEEGEKEGKVPRGKATMIRSLFIYFT